MFSAPASGDTYQFGDPIEIRVDFDRLVTITGTPQINLTVGSATRAVGITGPAVHFRSRTSSLFFEYTVAAADSDADGISVAADAISLNGGSIKAAADGTTDADLTHAALTPGSGHKMYGSKNEVPVVSSVSFVGSPAGGETYELGETIELKVEFHRFIDYSSGLQVELTIGGQTALASHSHGRGFGGGVTEIYFDYDVRADDFDANGMIRSADAQPLAWLPTIYSVGSAGLSHATESQAASRDLRRGVKHARSLRRRPAPPAPGNRPASTPVGA